MTIPDNATPDELGPEPEGFWEPVHEQVRAWLDKYGDDSEDPR